MSISETELRHCLLALVLLAGCASEGLAPGPSAHGELRVELPAREAATLLAELAARELDQFRRDQITPLCRVERSGPGSYRIYYQSGDGGGFEPYANLEIRRQRFLAAGSPLLLRPLPESPLGNVEERLLERPLAPGNGARFAVDVTVEALGDTRCEVRLACSGSVLGTAADRVRRWSEALRYTAGLRRVFGLVRAGKPFEARLRIDDLGSDFRHARGVLEQDLHAMRHALLARIECDERSWHAAERACGHALILAPESYELHEMRNLIARRLGDRVSAARSHWRSLAYSVPGRRNTAARDLGAGEDWLAYCRREAEKALHRRDRISARSWLQRALDVDSSDLESLRILARVADAEDDTREARDLFLTLLQRHGARPGIIGELAAYERRVRSPDAAFRALLRWAREHPGLMQSAEASELLRELSPETLARSFRDEGFSRQATEWFLRWRKTRGRLPQELAQLFRRAPGSSRPSEDPALGETWVPEHGPGIRTIPRPARPGR